ncbi:MAG: HAD-IA family hydrolase [Armatimonadetes bacterium]|nr:HAD-IA family hydrolase [Armatimonadota bacterium]
MKPKVVCFDLGGVLVDVCHTWDQVWRHMDEQPHRALTGPLTRFLPFDRYQAGQISGKQYLAELAEAAGMDEDWAMQAHFAILREEIPGVSSLVNEAKSAGLGTGCLSNTNELHWPFLTDPDRYPTIAGLEHKVASHRVKADKPNAEIYAHFEKLARIRPDQIVYFDDVQDYVSAAQDRGWHGYVIDRNMETAAQMRRHLHQEGALEPENV